MLAAPKASSWVKGHIQANNHDLAVNVIRALYFT